MKQAPLINTLNVNISVEGISPVAAGLIRGFLASGTTRPEPAKDAHSETLEAPEIGAYWAGQGGIYGGVRQYPEGLCHVIYAQEDAGNFKWGPSGTETGATSRFDGRTNTQALLTLNAGFPAAFYASQYTADGQSDFYLPSAAELNHGWAYLSDRFEEGCYWSSTQRSAYNAFFQYFDDGSQYNRAKISELRVRPVRRFIR
ncbi:MULTISPECIES: DUF1566 domain-containing protein [Pseudomonas syringae group]|uniref:DUF1566 domain-containing protein n=1 Tax=Pseudomonas syringae pv. coriandricola TaxID=264453 RepID=A0A3M3JU20_9PSED|nr:MULTISPECIES: DUF1566 domain-containing protein [Pseudomonas syringae group]RMN14424.1 hypothetical protein ALQ65_102155 [Pseudomonas syringae pv. coriandricola]